MGNIRSSQQRPPQAANTYEDQSQVNKNEQQPASDLKADKALGMNGQIGQRGIGSKMSASEAQNASFATPSANDASDGAMLQAAVAKPDSRQSAVASKDTSTLPSQSNERYSTLQRQAANVQSFAQRLKRSASVRTKSFRNLLPSTFSKKKVSPLRRAATETMALCTIRLCDILNRPYACVRAMLAIVAVIYSNRRSSSLTNAPRIV